MSRRAGVKLAGRIAAVAVLAAFVHPPAATAVVHWVAEHDMVDVPYVRDCRGLYPRPAECPSGDHSARPGPNGTPGPSR